MLRVNLPIDVVVLNCWVTETKDTFPLSKIFHDLGEVTERACQSIHLVDDHGVDPMALDIRKNPLQGGSFKGAAGDAAVIVHLGQRGPALVLLTEDKGFAGFPLGIERVEVLLEAVLR